MINLMIAKLPN